MAPPGRQQNAMYRVRTVNPLVVPIRRSLEKATAATPAEIRRYQDRRLRRLVAFAARRSPFYGRWFAESGVDPGSIRGLDDLARLPLLDRQHLVEGAPEFMTYPSRLLWEARSSGTSGTVITTFRTAGSSIFELAAQERQHSWFGLPRRPRRAVLRGRAVPGAHQGEITTLVPGARQLRISSFHLSPSTVGAVIDAVHRYRPHVIEGWPSSITVLATLIRDAGTTLPLQGVLTSSEVVTDRQRALMQEVFEGPVIDHYGQTERVCMAGNCEAGNYHVFPDYGIVELIPADDDPDSAEIVGTPLHNWGFPLFRYRTGDRVRLDGPTSCPCGRQFPLLGRIDGRVEEAFTAADGRPIPLPHCLMGDLPRTRESQVVQHGPGDFEIRMVPGVGFDRQAAEDLVRTNVQQLVGPGQHLSFQVLDRVPRTGAGKLRAALLLNDRVGKG